jgi:ribosome biogenesis GTPase A
VKKIASKKYQHINIDNWADLIRKIEATVDIESLKLHELQIGNEQVSTSNDPISDSSSKDEKKFITIGCCGFPNVGKSSLLNSLFGKKVVSVSRTPGHTKHLQTLYLTNTVRLCDCPGLVFPSLVSKPLQILAGIYPIAQLQEPYSTIRYLSERIPIIEQLKITHPHEDNEWSPLDICEAWAIKRRYYTAKAARPDTHRSANELLRMALDGRLCLALRPPNFSIEKGNFF